MAIPDVADKARDIISILQCTCLERIGSVIMMIVENSPILNSALQQIQSESATTNDDHVE